MVNVAVFCSGFAVVYYLKTENCKNTATLKKVNFRPVAQGGSQLWWAVLIGSWWQLLVVGDSAVGWWVAMTGLRWLVGG